ncbi:MAG TPA: Hsp20/alpha crystallin family protein [Terriglobia bacterium]|nr:Hsp20/alpha crystallin family protein [Terriglobia bacterium]
MSITRWEPFRDLISTQERFNQLFNEAFGRAFGDLQEVTPRTWAPAVDIYETDENLVLQAELPGINPDDVDIRIEDNTLYLKGERKFEKEVKEGNLHRVERSYGTFTRSFTLPGSINVDKVKAEYKNGILTLTMPKREEAKPKTIKIQAAKA